MTTPADPPSTYRFLTTSTLTGTVLADTLPIVGQSCTRQINSVGSFTGAIALPTAAQMAYGGYTLLNQGTPVSLTYFILSNSDATLMSPGQVFQIVTGAAAGGTVYTVTSIGASAFGFTNINFAPALQTGQFLSASDDLTMLAFTAQSAYQVRQWIEALEPWSSILWVLQDGVPVWNGPVTGQPNQTITDGQLQIQAASMEEFFKHRQISDNLIFDSVDVFQIFTQELQYATSKTPNGAIAGIAIPGALSGTLANVTELATMKKIYDAWNDLVSAYSLEYAFTPLLTSSGALSTQLQMGIPVMGRPYASTGLSVVFPSRDTIDYGWQRGSGSSTVANRIVASGSSTGTSGAASYVSQLPHGQAAAELAAGYPLLEDSVSLPHTVTAQSQVDDYADGYVASTAILAQIIPTFTLGATAYPKARDITLGDQVAIAATSPLHPAQPVTGAPGVTGLFRITGWTLTFPSQGQPETTMLQLGGLASVAV